MNQYPSKGMACPKLKIFDIEFMSANISIAEELQQFIDYFWAGSGKVLGLRKLARSEMILSFQNSQSQII